MRAWLDVHSEKEKEKARPGSWRAVVRVGISHWQVRWGRKRVAADGDLAVYLDVGLLAGPDGPPLWQSPGGLTPPG